MFKFFKKHEESITDRYLRLMDEGKCQESLSVIEQIIAQNPNISTSYFNYGVCLSQLERFNDASTAYLRAYELNDTDGGALYKACISLAKANNKVKLFEVFKSELEKDPYMINNFIKEEIFENYFSESEFMKLKEQYENYIGKEE
jgi:tetratricopeptide (TPR) repeat protein